MNKNTAIITILATLVILLSGACGTTLYIPNTVNTPLLEKKNDFKVVNGFVSNAPEIDYDLQGSYAVSDHLAVMANFNFMNSSIEERENHHNLVEGGVGAYASFWPNRRGVHVGRLELFGGIGQGWARDQEDHTGAWNDYVRLCRAGGSRSFLQLVALAGLESPFQPGCLQKVMEPIQSYLEQVNDSHF